MSRPDESLNPPEMQDAPIGHQESSNDPHPSVVRPHFVLPLSVLPDDQDDEFENNEIYEKTY
jgi:hypothetical protein